MTTLIIARHGNTFGPDDIPTRVGGRTDLPLVEKGFAQGTAMGAYLAANGLVPDVVYASHLQRTQQTAQAALDEMGTQRAIETLDIFNEIDYGPDENMTEDVVIARIGEQAIKDWDAHAIVPNGWVVDPNEIIENWKRFTAALLTEHAGKTILVVTSNGIARFAPHITGDFAEFAAHNKIKLSTGALALLKHDGERWTITDWNVKP